jgi:hypothetical protein
MANPPDPAGARTGETKGRGAMSMSNSREYKIASCPTCGVRQRVDWKPSHGIPDGLFEPIGAALRENFAIPNEWLVSLWIEAARARGISQTVLDEAVAWADSAVVSTLEEE